VCEVALKLARSVTRSLSMSNEANFKKFDILGNVGAGPEVEHVSNSQKCVKAVKRKFS
jgi:hypothetical protein